MAEEKEERRKREIRKRISFRRWRWPNRDRERGIGGSRTTGLEFRERWRSESWGSWEGEGLGGLGLRVLA